MAYGSSIPNPSPKFQRFYIDFATVKKGFIAGCGLAIGLDGCFMENPYKGEILIAIGRYTNNQIYPLTWIVVQ